MKQNKKTRRARLFTLAALLVVLMFNVYVGRAEEEPFGNITKLWEIPFYKPFYDDGPFLIDTSRKNVYVLRYYGGSDKNEHDTLHVFDLETGNIKKNIHFDINMGPYQFINNKSTMVVFSKDIKFFDCNSLELIKAEPYPNEMYYMTLFSEDGKTIVGCNNASVVQIYDYENNILLDTIPMERVEQYGYSTRPPGDIRISPDKKYILTVTSYEGYQQTIPAVTIFHVYDLSTRESIMRFVAKSPSQYVLSNDWKYLYVAERKFDQQKNETEITLNEISTDGLDKRTQKFIDESFNELFISDNNKFLIYQPYPIKFRYFNLLDKKLSIEPNLFSNINIYRLQQIKDGYLFLTSINGLSCYNINNSILSNISYYDSTSLILYPNPTTNDVRISEIDLQNKIIKLTESNGADVTLVGRLSIFPNETLINLNGLANGTYFLNISDKKGSKTYIIKKI